MMATTEPMEVDRQTYRVVYWQATGDTILSLPSAQPDMHGWEESARKVQLSRLAPYGLVDVCLCVIVNKGPGSIYETDKWRVPMSVNASLS